MTGTKIVSDWRRWTYLALGLLALANGGCLAVAAGAAGTAAVGYAYCKGKVSQTYSSSFDNTWSATRAALGDFGMAIASEERTPGGTGTLHTKTSDGTSVKIDLEVEPSPIPAETTVTKVSVRVGVFGDDPLSERLLQQIGAHLVPAGPPVPGAPANPANVQQTGGWVPAPPATPPPPAGAPPSSAEPPPLKPVPADH